TALASYTLGTNLERLTGTSAAGQTLTGNAVDNVLTGGTGNDRLDGGAGADQLAGGLGDDVYIVDGVDFVIEAAGAGNDEVRTAVAAYTIGAHIEALTGTAASGQSLTGNAGANWISGGAGNDRLDGGGGIDWLAGGLGDDSYFVDDQSDYAHELPGQGTDRVYTRVSAALPTGSSIEIFSTADDAGKEALVLAGNELDNRIIGNAGNNTLYGLDGNDRMEGLGGNDLFLMTGNANGSADGDTALGGGGDDIYVLDSAADKAVELAGEGTDEIRTALDVYSLEAIAQVENLTGTSAAGQVLTGNGLGNVLFGGMGDDVLNGLAGNDTLIGFGGFDTLRGQAGDDVYIIDAADTIVELAGDGFDEVRTQAEIFVLADTLENLRANSDIGHDFRGNQGSNVIVGGDGKDIIRAQDGGGDLLFGKAGIDSFYFGGAFDNGDFVDGGDGRDTILLQGNHDLTLTWNITGASSVANVEEISLLSGAVTTYGQSGAGLYSYRLRLVDGNVAAGQVLKIDGSMLGTGENMTIDASAETDGLLQTFGGLGRDVLTGGARNDAFVFGDDGRFAAGDAVNGGGGDDIVYLRGDYRIDFGAASFAGALTNVEGIVLLGSAQTELAAGGDGDFDYWLTWSDTMLGAGAAMMVDATGLRSHETFIFDGVRETDGLLNLSGGAAGDTLIGGAGADQLHGGGGGDLLRGGAGADLFRYSATGDSVLGASDTIEDFVAGQDKIDLNRVDAKASTAENEAFAFIGAAAFTGAGGEVRAVHISGSLWRVEADANGDARADLFLEVHLAAGQALTAAEFIL
ncbi:MAG TPA: calcium-binding protein, partial [Allosphingosinicella sp.]